MEVLRLYAIEHTLCAAAEGQFLNVEDRVRGAIDIDFDPAIPLSRSVEVDNLAESGPLAVVEIPKTGANRSAVRLPVRRSISALAKAIVAAKIVTVEIRGDVEVELALAFCPEHETAREAAVVVSAARTSCSGVFVFTSILEAL